MHRPPASIRSFALTAAFLACLAFAASAFGVTLTRQPAVAVGRDAATVTWGTDVESGSRLNYGATAAAMTQRADGKVGADHSVTITGLAPGTTYFFAVGSSRQRLAEGSFTTNATTATTASRPADAPRGPPATPVPAASSDKTKPGLLSGILSKVGLGKSAAAASRPAAATPLKPPPARVTWGNFFSLQDHFDRHGRDFQATSPDDYAAKAWLFREQSRATAAPMKLDSDGTVRMWDGRTRTFAAYNRDGTTKTFFKPGSPDYWQRQPGRPVTPAQLPFK